MRKTDAAAKLDTAQAAIAESGVKALIPIDRPFLDYVLTVVADAGYRRVCLVIGPEHEELRNYYAATTTSRLQISFAVQQEPLGTADAVIAAESFAGGEPFLMINSDNHYPREALQGLRQAGGPAVAVFDEDAMLAGSNIPAERLCKFAVVETDAAGRLRRIIEKPDPETLARLPKPRGVSMNCWRFGPAIFEACRSIGPSPRGELEIPDAVQYSIDHLGERYEVVQCNAPVLDLSSRADVAPVAALLAGKEVKL
jgi:glucose-1-phosphate thymidylyltransferase